MNKSDNFHDTPIFYEKEKIVNFIPRDVECEYLQVPKTVYLSENEIHKKLIHSIEKPFNSPSLSNLISNHYKNHTITILVDDNTRPNIHTKTLLPLIEDQLLKLGVKKSDIRVLIATGTHQPPTDSQIQAHILGDLYSEWKNRLWVHDCDANSFHVDLGFSSAKTPILVDKRILESDIVIPLSDSEYHYFAGVAGSVKLILPGVSGRKTVRVNHSKIFDLDYGFKQECKMGNIEGNVSIQDIREIVSSIQKTHSVAIFVIDAILNKGKFVDIFAGDPLTIHEHALTSLSKIRDVQLQKRGDLVIIGKPSVNYYQAGKGLNAASHAVKPGGTILLLAGCPEGIGPDEYLETMQEVKDKSYRDAMQWVIRNKCSPTTFEIGIQNAVDLFRILEFTQGNLHLYSSFLDAKLMKDVFRINTLPINLSPEESLRKFVTKFIADNPKSKIVVFEDYNLLAKDK
ncbi:MAG: lactate racemase domain-containing protein [Candidatus Hodarchaeales archaeon]|jgi:nickel-dependent lactate racemase